jgi:parvulin-like peptidyl-prolyl isomerase
MQRLISSAVILFLLASAAPAAASPGMAAPGAGAAPNLKGLTVTLEVPANSPHLTGLALPPVNSAAKGTKAGVKKLQVPVTEGKYARLPLAVVDGEPITVGELHQALRPLPTPGTMEGEEVSVAGQNPQKLLSRLIDSRILTREAREIGIDRLPEVRNLVGIFERQTLRDLLVRKRLAAVKADPNEVENLYRRAVKETKIKGVLFPTDKEAKAFAAKLKAGGSFEALALKAVKQKAEVKGGAGGEFVRNEEMLPEMAKAVEKAKPGGVTGVIAADKKFAIVKVLEIRYPKNPHARAEAQQRALNFAQNAALVAYSRSLNQKYVSIERKLFEGIDFGKDLDKLRKDQRVLARIKGEAPVTVAEVAEALKGKYYHGVGRAIEQGKIKTGKIDVFNDLVAKRVFVREALATRIDRSTEFRTRLKEYENSVVFGAFMQKALIPEVKTTLDDLRGYYQRHRDDYTYPEMLSLRALIFTDKAAAQKALDQLTKGTDFSWLAANAGGQVAAEKEGVLQFSEAPVTTRSLSASLRKTLAQPKAGSYRLHAEKNYFYVLAIGKVIPSRVQPFEEVQKEILQAVFQEKLEALTQEWTRKLRATYPVEIYATGFNKSTL